MKRLQPSKLIEIHGGNLCDFRGVPVPGGGPIQKIGSFTDCKSGKTQWAIKLQNRYLVLENGDVLPPPSGQ